MAEPIYPTFRREAARPLPAGHAAEVIAAKVIQLLPACFACRRPVEHTRLRTLTGQARAAGKVLDRGALTCFACDQDGFRADRV